MALETANSHLNGTGDGKEPSQWHWRKQRALSMALEKAKSPLNGTRDGKELSQWHNRRQRAL